MAQPARSYASVFSRPTPQPSTADRSQQPDEDESKQSTSRPDIRSNIANDKGRQNHQRHKQTNQATPRPKRTSSPGHDYTPKTASQETKVYVLTLLTDAKHHQTMTSMRDRYFPPKLNRLEAHLTLFHALPGSKLDEAIVPTLRSVSASTAAFPILAATPFRLRKGIAVGVPKSKGGDEARGVHSRLKEAWAGFLSQQDAGGFAAHYTIMNKAADEREVQRAFEEVEGSWTGCRGLAEGLSLFRYDGGDWTHVEDFRFSGGK